MLERHQKSFKILFKLIQRIVWFPLSNRYTNKPNC